MRIGDEAVAADLVARKRLRVDEDDAAAGAGEPLRRRGAGRAGADDDRVAALGKEIEIEVHEGRGSCRVALGRRPGPMRQAATMAQAVIAPTSAKVSWKAAIGCGGVRAQAPFEDVADQADADRAAELAQEVDRARALRDQRVAARPASSRG